MKTFFRTNGIVLVVGIAFLASTVLAVRNNYIIEENQVILEQVDLAKETTESILVRIMHGLDLGVRGYALTRDEKLLVPYNEAIQITPSIFRRIDSLLNIQNYEKRDMLRHVKLEVNAYIGLSKEMVNLVKDERIDEVTRLLKEDRGYNVWKKYSDFSTPLVSFENNLAEKSLRDYQLAIKTNLILQIGILILVFPTILIFVRKVNREKRKREATLHEVALTDRTFAFNRGDRNATISEDVNAVAVQNVKDASTFIAALAEGDYSIQWPNIRKEHYALNEKTLAGNLFRLRDRLSSVKLEDERRHWVNEGLTQFSDIVRSHENNLNTFAVTSISFLTNYINGNQGALFVADEFDGESFLVMKGCYAFDKRRFVDRKIPVGSGMIGQAFLEGEPVVLRKVPAGYTHITSGLGEATPAHIAIIPFKHDRKVVGVIEFASFKEILPHQVTYLERAGELLASAIHTANTNSSMRKLLEDAGAREENLRQKEEELLQNMEELQAIQEQLQRDTKERQESPFAN